jgi:tetratricopeptide (TPR) repeat protein
LELSLSPPLVGEADRAFRLGTLLERNGQARKASAAFHEAATLYQCYLESRSEFAHVTSLFPQSECVSILAYTCLRLAFLNQDALGDANAAVRLYKEAAAIDPSPSAASYDGLGESLEASSGGSRLDEARDAYEKALALAPDSRPVQFHLAVALERLGRAEDAERWFAGLRRCESEFSCLVDSWGCVFFLSPSVKAFLVGFPALTVDTMCLVLYSVHLATFDGTPGAFPRSA